ncbi:MAG: acyl-CoA dehydrogenase family protein [Acidobacteriota bacterium]|nr:acyl-CoA dehydrogenase family protein [Acidobacteriota bacterium]
MSDLSAFREEARTWVEANAPEFLRGRASDPNAWAAGGRKAPFIYPESRDWLLAAADRGFSVPTWPEDYGGAGLSRDEALVLHEEIARLGLPMPLTGFGYSMIGPTLLDHGTEAQRAEHLPKIARGEIRWCQGYSEPNAGSDLASLATSAVRDGDFYVINGQKIWTSGADQADWIFMLVRTNPDVKKQRGITFILVDMESPGVEVRPIRLISGASPFCETFFHNVRAPVHQVIGEVNSGWTVAKALLGHERTSIGGMGRGGARASLPGLARDYVGVDENGRIDDPAIRERVTQHEMDAMSYGLTIKRHGDGLEAGHKPGPESSMFKYYGTELNMRREELMLSIRGPQALGWEGEGFEPAELNQTRTWLRSRANSIEGGTSEIQLNIIAKRVLGLPD